MNPASVAAEEALVSPLHYMLSKNLLYVSIINLREHHFHQAFKVLSDYISFWRRFPGEVLSGYAMHGTVRICVL